MPTDYDGDSQMASSSESGARTPTMTHVPDMHSSELSPPGSQQMQRTTDISRLEREGSVGPGAATGQVQGQGQGQDQKSKTKPGEWRSKRAEDEYQRAMEFVVDKDFSLKELGDLFDERDMEEELP